MPPKAITGRLCSSNSAMLFRYRSKLLPSPSSMPSPVSRTTPSSRRHIHSIQSTLPTSNRYNNLPSLPVLKSSPRASGARKRQTLLPRTGVLAHKAGMSAIFDEKSGARHPVTILQLDRVQVVAHKTPAREGYYAVQVGHGWRPTQNNLSRAMRGHFAAHGVAPKRDLHEFRVRDAAALALSPVGAVLGAGWFKTGQFIDARGPSKGKGFAGGMKKHGMKGQGASHGNSLSHRAMGSAGQSQGGGSRVYPGKRMPGRMGGNRATVQNLKVVRVDGEKGIVVVHGCVVGPKGCIVMLSDAIKKPWPNLSFLKEPVVEEVAEQEIAPEVTVV